MTSSKQNDPCRYELEKLRKHHSRLISLLLTESCQQDGYSGTLESEIAGVEMGIAALERSIGRCDACNGCDDEKDRKL
jgi:hypothetical protein